MAEVAQPLQGPQIAYSHSIYTALVASRDESN